MEGLGSRLALLHNNTHTHTLPPPWLAAGVHPWAPAGGGGQAPQRPSLGGLRRPPHVPPGGRAAPLREGAADGPQLPTAPPLPPARAAGGGSPAQVALARERMCVGSF